MLERLLILSEYDPFGAYPYSAQAHNNTGNNVYIRSICSCFAVPGARVVTFAEAEAQLADDPSWCRRNFDAVVTYEACVFAKMYRAELRRLARFFRLLGVKVFVIGVGIIAPRGETVRLIQDYEEAAKDYLDAIFSSGGALAVRGALSRDVCSRLGFGDVFVSGCGSLYYGGKDFAISNDKVERRNFVPAFNGYLVDDINSAWYREHPRSVFFDQDLYYRALLYPELVSDDELHRIFSRSLPWLYGTVRGMSGRLQTRQDPSSWQHALLASGASFSYGSRMHGNAIALLTGIPCFLKVIDDRTAELAELYRLPSSLSCGFDERHDSLYDLYRSLDWTEFNSNYQRLYRSFAEWVARCGLPSTLSEAHRTEPPRERWMPEADLPIRQAKLLRRIKRYAWRRRFLGLIGRSA